MRKTQGLAYPQNPLAAMRELQDLDAPPGPTGASAGATAPQSALPVAPATSRATSSATTRATAPPGEPQVAQATSSDSAPPASSATSSAVAQVGSSEEGDTAGRAKSAKRPKGKGAENPMSKAVREILSRPYEQPDDGGRFTVTTVKLPAEVWERLGWVAAVSGRTKQDILADALKAHFAQLAGEI